VILPTGLGFCVGLALGFYFGGYVE